MNKIDFDKVERYYQKASYHKQHDELNMHEWQYALRKRFAEKSTFGIKKLEGHPVFCDYMVRNPESTSQYKVSIRDNDNSRNFCTCYDFKTNNLGTCKHIEAVLFKINNSAKLSKYLVTTYNPPYSSLYIDYRDNRSVKLRIGTDCALDFEAFRTKYFDEENRLNQENYDKFYDIHKEASLINNSFKCYPDVISKMIDYNDSISRKRLVEQKFPTTNGAFDSIINAKLFPYQKQGVQFAAKAGRSLLADDMGLGKTIQAIATAELLKNEFGISKVLIVCPTSLKYQWKAEIKKFTGSEVTVIEGLPQNRPEQYRTESLYAIVSYHTATNDIKELEKLKPDLVILDEAQRIKNFKTKVSQTIKKIPSDYALVLTGTPLENKLEELYSIVQFIDPFALGPYHEFMARHQIKTDTGKITGYKDLNRIGEILSGLMLRRTKKEVMDQLPERMDKVLFVPMTEQQMNYHTEFQQIVANLVFKWQRMGFLSDKDRNRLMINMNMMRMVCDSTYILDQQTRHDTKVDELMNIVDEMIAGGTEKMVVFSQWERMTRVVSTELDKKGIKYEYLHGGIPSVKREALFTNFNNDPEVRIFLSTDAGGTGLNLQSASMMVNLDIPWNPAVLEQRIARIYRLGQKKNVSIINLVSAQTIEHRMLDVLSFKSSLAEGVLDSGEDSIFMEDGKFKKFMNSVGEMVDATNSEGRQTVQVVEEKETETPELEKQPDLFSEIPVEPEANNAFEEIETVENPSDNQPEENLLTQGLKFLGRLSETLADKEATQKLVASVTEKDEQTGQTYLKVPVESEKIIENAVLLLGSLLKNLK